ncbi:hypothetical protein MM213_10285 [Belliella sp. R4-6]|uniref:Uncharacterized protein n=1 Tax=Belliella alkalica TaxID=1730871 RepID=A0ABS9VCB6_9BACT|nr:hypothetical protein [Belliella alkalica]MCH7413874.1 hypothetical protein [Belliella alkalica]
MKLQNITSDYKSFADNQLLTAAQLNLLVQYLDNQDRLSRLALTGAGIVCGMEVSLSDDVLTISQGTALTTDGDLIKLRNKNSNSKKSPIAIQGIDFVAYLPFSNHKVQYEPFLESKESYIPILELLTEEEAKSFPSSKNISDIKINDYVVVLYLENYTKPYDVCNESDCDSQGIPEISRLRYFLIDKENVGKVVLKNDTIFNQFGKIKDLTGKNVKIERVIASTLIQKESIYLEKYNDVAKEATIRFNQACKDLFEILGKSFGFELPLSLKARNIFVPKPFPNAQYNYDFLLDLMATYDEIKDLTLKIDSICNHEINSFPKHILLGTIEDDSIRHGFYKSSALANDQNVKGKINMLLNRLDAMVTNFNGGRNIEIQIRPSKLCANLSEKAIPRYYLENSPLRKNWKFGSTERDQQEINSEKDLGFDLSCKDFFRIEGAFDLNWATALDAILKKKVEYGLNFDVVCLNSEMEMKDLDLNDFPVLFKDLQTNLSAWRAQQICLLQTATTFLTGFSTKADGGHNHVKDYFIRETFVSAVYENPVGSFRDIYGMTSSTEKAKTTEVKSELPKEESRKKSTSNADLYNVVNIAGTRKLDVVEEAHYYKQPTSYFPITKGAEDIGKGFESFNEVKGNYSFHDLVAIYEGQLVSVIPDLKNWAEVDKEMRVTFPTKLMAAIQTLNKEFPTNINFINEAKLGSFEAALDNLCKLTNEAFNFISETINDAGNDYVKKDFEDHYLAILNRLKENCCAGDFLKVIFQETIDRKKRILEDTRFSNFVAKHPGLEHMAGVPNAGTFVLLYNAKTNRVIADFALPYICCSKNAPIAFMVTPPIEDKEDVQFDIEPTICKRDKETVKVPFEIIPQDAEINLATPFKGLSIKNNILSIDQNFKDFEIPIQFVSAGKLLEKSIKVIQKGLLELSYEFDKEREAFIVKSNLPYANYQWYINEKEFKGESSEYLIIDKEFKKEIKVSLMVETPCGKEESQISINPPIEDEEAISFSIEPQHCKDPKNQDSIPFSLVPNRTKISLESDYSGLSINGNNLIITAEFDAYDKPIYFILNGQKSKQSITIIEQKELVLSHQYIAESNLHVITSNISVEEFHWTFNKKKITSETSEKIELTDFNAGKNSVSLSIQTECGLLTTDIEFDHKGKEESDCSSKALERLSTLKVNLARLIGRSELRVSIEKDLSALSEFVQDFEKNTKSYISGNNLGNFSGIHNSFENLNSKVFDERFFNHREVIIEVYKISLEMVYAMMTCIDGKVLEEMSGAFNMLFNTIENHLKNPEYTKMLLALRNLIEELIEFRIKNGANDNEDILIIHLSRLLSILKELG